MSHLLPFIIERQRYTYENIGKNCLLGKRLLIHYELEFILLIIFVVKVVYAKCECDIAD